MDVIQNDSCVLVKKTNNNNMTNELKIFRVICLKQKGTWHWSQWYLPGNVISDWLFNRLDVVWSSTRRTNHLESTLLSQKKNLLLRRCFFFVTLFAIFFLLLIGAELFSNVSSLSLCCSLSPSSPFAEKWIVYITRK